MSKTEATAKVRVEIESTDDLADRVRLHIEEQVAKALANDETMRTYVVRALTDRTEKSTGPWLRSVIDEAIRNAARAEVLRQIEEARPDIEDKIGRLIRTKLPAICSHAVDHLMGVRR